MVLGFLYQMFLWIFSGKQYIKYKTKHISKIIISRKGLPFFKKYIAEHLEHFKHS